MTLDSTKYFDQENGSFSVDGYAVAALGLTVLGQAIHNNAVDHGWWETQRIVTRVAGFEDQPIEKVVPTRNFGDHQEQAHLACWERELRGVK